MAIFSNTKNSMDDPLLPYLSSIKQALDESNSSSAARSRLDDLLEECVAQFKDNDRYRNDIRFIKIWILYADAIQDFESVFNIMDAKKIGLSHSVLYISYAVYLEIKGKLTEADDVYRMGISRNAEPLAELKRFHSEFLKRMSGVVKASQLQKKEPIEHEKDCINPWSISTIDDLLRKINRQLVKYNGYHMSAKAYSGKVALSSLHNSSRNKIIGLGAKKYQIKGCAGQGGFAQVFKAHVNSNPDDVVALKIQTPPFPWEFYMYRQLDKRIPDEKRSNFAFAHEVHIYSDYSILVSDYLAHGTVLDAINFYEVNGRTMEEVLCIYYSMEMLHMLETLHSVGIIHGDFKPDNLLIRYAGADLTVDGFSGRTGPWHDQGLCLIDWGRGIDLSLFPKGKKFTGDCRTACFQCVEMQEHRPWKYQVDTYGLCVIAHLMLHGGPSYMSVGKKTFSDGKVLYQPKSSLRRYWNVDLWSNFFTKLLNAGPDDDHVSMLQNLRKSFEDYMNSNPQLIKKLTELLQKQRVSMCSS